MRWLDQFRCRCPEATIQSLVSASKAGNAPVPVPEHSPARALARSLTDPRTRDEWTRTRDASPVGLGYYSIAKYRNDARDITVARTSGSYIGPIGEITTPFTLTKAEKAIVASALDDFDKWRQSERELAALGRLLAQAGEAGTAETGTGSVHEHAVPAGDAP